MLQHDHATDECYRRGSHCAPVPATVVPVARVHVRWHVGGLALAVSCALALVGCGRESRDLPAKRVLVSLDFVSDDRGSPAFSSLAHAVSWTQGDSPKAFRLSWTSALQALPNPEGGDAYVTLVSEFVRGHEEPGDEVIVWRLRVPANWVRELAHGVNSAWTELQLDGDVGTMPSPSLRVPQLGPATVIARPGYVVWSCDVVVGGEAVAWPSGRGKLTVRVES